MLLSPIIDILFFPHGIDHRLFRKHTYVRVCSVSETYFIEDKIKDKRNTPRLDSDICPPMASTNDG